MKKTITLLAALVLCIYANAATIQGDTLLVNKAREAANAKDFPKALELFLEADKTFTPDTTDYYGNVQHNIGYVYFMMEDKRNAARYWERALKMFPQFSEKHEKLLEILGYLYMDLDDTKNAMRIMELQEAHNQHELQKPCTTMKDCLDRVQYYEMKGETDKVKEHLQLAAEMAKTATSEEREQYYIAYAKYLSDNGDRVGGAGYYKMAAEEHKASKGEDELWTMNVYLSGLQLLLSREWAKAYDDYATAFTSFERQGNEQYMRLSLRAMGNCLYFQGQYQEAKDMFQRELTGLPTNPHSEDYAKALENIGKADKRLNNFDAAIDTLTRVIEIYKELGKDIELQSALAELNSVKVRSGQGYDDSVGEAGEEAGRKAMERVYAEEEKNLASYKLIFGEDGVQYANSLGLVAEYTYLLKDKQLGVERYREYIATERKAIRRAFVFQNEKERYATWQLGEDNRDKIVEKISDAATIEAGLDGAFNAMAYDLQLLSKGILLNSSIEFAKVVDGSGNAKAKELYAKAKAKNSEIELLQSGNQSGQNAEKIAAARNEYDRLMLQLMQECQELKDYTAYLDYTWENVKDSLGDKDVAIEFVELKTAVPDNLNIIAALILTNKMVHPAAVPVCIRRDAQIMMRDPQALSNEQYGDIVWKNIAPLLTGYNNIYFSADAEIASLGIEYMLYQGKPIIDQYNVYRLSSTKEICRKHQPLQMHNVALFGGINYNEEGTKVDVKFKDSVQRTLSDETSGVLSFAPLAGTGPEVEAIKKLVEKQKGCKAQLFTESKASEQTFKALSDKAVDIIHIATHGAFKGGKNATEQDAMQHSILAMSGCNVPTLDDLNDGFLSAQDVAAMNLHKCQLAVLSACETGLGSFSTDGVFGLQRGFKNAGVRTLLMSLHRVNDAATKELMIQFYKALPTAPNANAALRKAQDYLRNNGYNDPRLWGAFIILDGQ